MCSSDLTSVARRPFFYPIVIQFTLMPGWLLIEATDFPCAQSSFGRNNNVVLSRRCWRVGARLWHVLWSFVRMGKPWTLLAVTLLALPTAAHAAPWRDEPAVAALFRDAKVQGTFVLLDETRGVLRGTNQSRAEQRFVPASSFKVANALIGLSLGVVHGVDEVIPYRGDARPLMPEIGRAHV